MLTSFPKVALCAAFVLTAGSAGAAITMDVEGNEDSVDIAFDGTLDFTRLPDFFSGDFGSLFRIGAIGVDVTLDRGAVEFSIGDDPLPYGLDGFIEASALDGTEFGQAGTGGRGTGFVVPEDYVDPTRLQGSLSLDGATLALLGLSEGSTVISQFCSFDDLVILVSDETDTSELPPVPLPGTLPLLLAAMGGIGYVARRRRAES